MLDHIFFLYIFSEMSSNVTLKVEKILMLLQMLFSSRFINVVFSLKNKYQRNILADLYSFIIITLDKKNNKWY
jgi:hypothetical protein